MYMTVSYDSVLFHLALIASTCLRLVPFKIPSLLRIEINGSFFTPKWNSQPSIGKFAAADVRSNMDYISLVKKKRMLG